MKDQSKKRRSGDFRIYVSMDDDLELVRGGFKSTSDAVAHLESDSCNADPDKMYQILQFKGTWDIDIKRIAVERKEATDGTE
jgi:hypothetical protein